MKIALFVCLFLGVLIRIMQLQYKKCTLNNLDELVAISKNTFITAFEKDNNPEDFKAYIDVAFEKNHIKKQLENPDSSFYFVFKSGQCVGYFKLNENTAQTDIKLDETIELERIYVLQEFQGQQIGSCMLQEAIKMAFERGKKYIWLGVWEKNRAAIRFYQKYGFSKFDTHPYYIGKDKQTDWLMRYVLDS